MGSNCCSDKVYYNPEESKSDENSQQFIPNLDFPRYKSSVRTTKTDQNLKITLNRPKRYYGELLNTSSQYWNINNNNRVVIYDLGTVLIVKNKFIYTAREYFAAKKIFKFLYKVKKQHLLSKRNTV